MPDFDRRPWSTRLARRLRKAMTDEEIRLWACLQHDLPWKFRRQEPIGPYICDFVCSPKRLVVEVDGVQHADDPRDAVRDDYLASAGFRGLRVWNGDVMHDLDAVLEPVLLPPQNGGVPSLRGKGGACPRPGVGPPPCTPPCYLAAS